jgi:hypothetical protein
MDVTIALSQLGIISAYQGKLKRAVEIFKKADEFAGQTASVHRAQNMLCRVQYILNDLEAAAENARLAVEMGERTGRMDSATVGFY